MLKIVYQYWTTSNAGDYIIHTCNLVCSGKGIALYKILDGLIYEYIHGWFKKQHNSYGKE